MTTKVKQNDKVDSKKESEEKQIEFVKFDGLNYFSRPLSIFVKSSSKPKLDEEDNPLLKDGKKIYEDDLTKPPITFIKMWDGDNVPVPFLEVYRCALTIVYAVEKDEMLQGELKKCEEYQKKYENNKEIVALPF